MAKDDGGLPRDTFYDVLSIRDDATLTEIKRAYKQQAFLHHPDRNHHPDAKARFQQIGQAYEVLSDSSRRRSYDLDLRRAALEQRERAERARQPYPAPMSARSVPEPPFFQDPFFPPSPPRFAQRDFTDPFELFNSFFHQHDRNMPSQLIGRPSHPQAFSMYGGGFGPTFMGLAGEPGWQQEPLYRSPPSMHSLFGQGGRSTFSSTSVQIINGVRKETRHTRDQNGRETIETIGNDGTRSVQVINEGLTQDRDRPMMTNTEPQPPAKRSGWGWW